MLEVPSIAAKNGLLLKNRNALEQANKVEYVLLDKTGTLTEGQFTVTGLELMSKQFTREEALKYIGALEKKCKSSVGNWDHELFK